MQESIHELVAVQLNAPLYKWKIIQTFSSEADWREREKLYRPGRRPWGEAGEITIRSGDAIH
jgi:hypothetical protein